ncbi:hypothetical protein EAI_17564 [Harpegnathos saltator]|uniref:Uncharacterized protein n=1 Tax=Harpegnathos saltator TaxID=610380 RepID=E2C5Q3_HARSA|nr:hypothetical protein EAI_17564 [Harpegnathos saltator]
MGAFILCWLPFFLCVRSSRRKQSVRSHNLFDIKLNIK